LKVVENTTYKPWHWLVVALLALTWGSSFFLMKKSLVGLMPFQVAALRIAITSIALLPFTILNFRKVEPSKIKYIVLSGLMGSGIPAFFFATAQMHLNSSLAGVLNSLTPVWALFLGMLFFKMKTSFNQILGILLGFCGAASLVIFGHHSNSLNSEISYALLIVFATFCYGMNLNILKTYLVGINPMSIASMSFFFIGIPACIYLVGFTDLFHRIQSNPNTIPSLGYISILGVVGTATASIVFYYLVQKTSTLFGAITTYFIPVVAVGWGIYDSEPITFMHFIGLGLILFGVWMVTRKK
jgi:drug/metabolite transporter (DMT)-like permease